MTTSYTPTVYANENSYSGGKALKLSIGKRSPGDIITVTVPVISTWSSGGQSYQVNANGAGIQTIGPNQPIAINWDQFVIGEADGYKFGIGSLIGSLDQGNSLVPIGTDFTTTILSKDVSELWLYYWDINIVDNSGQIQASVTVIPAT